MTREEYEKKIAALEPLDNEKRKRVTCSLLGHSHITTGCFGYVYCARCGEQIGDVLGGFFYDPLEVRVGHNCPTCRANYEEICTCPCGSMMEEVPFSMDYIPTIGGAQ